MIASLEATEIARKGNKIAGMKSVADQVEDFMSRSGLNTSTKMANHVGTDRQNIDNVRAGKMPRTPLLKKLADAMGTTMDVLLAGRYVYGQKPAEPVVQGYPWPFEWITPERWASLTERQRGVVEKAAVDALEEVAPASSETRFSRAPGSPSGKRRAAG